jgi:hypothetical protein
MRLWASSGSGHRVSKLGEKRDRDGTDAARGTGDQHVAAGSHSHPFQRENAKHRRVSGRG